MSDLFADHVSYADRSTLQRYSLCPKQARLMPAENVVGHAANVGNGGHEAISQTVESYWSAQGNMSRTEVAECLRTNLRNARTDIQPGVLDAFSPMVFAFADFLVNTHFADLMRWDGGKDEHDGQLAWKTENGFSVTSELDLLTSTRSPEVLREHDWKSGWGVYDIDSVEASFQFRTHAVLVFANYETVNTLQVCVWNTRHGKRLPPVEFHRSRLADYSSLVMGGLQNWCAYESAPIENVPAWPSAEKCRICSVARHCPAADPDLKADPLVLLESFCAVEAKRDAIHKLLRSHVQKTKTDLVAPNGMRFGTEKPVKRRVSYAAYSDAHGESESDE